MNGEGGSDMPLAEDPVGVSAGVRRAMRWLAQNRGVEVIEIAHEHPASFDSLVQTYRDAFLRYPRL